METFSLRDVDLRWVFPGLDDPGEVREVLQQAAADLESLAAALGAHTSSNGGIEFHRMPSGHTSLSGYVEGACDVVFLAALNSWDRDGNAVTGPPWLVEGQVAVSCDGRTHDGEHRIEDREIRVDSPVAAARALREVTAWLRQRGLAEPVESWRRRDTTSGHS